MQPAHQARFIKLLPFAHQEEMKKNFAKAGATSEERWGHY